MSILKSDILYIFVYSDSTSGTRQESVQTEFDIKTGYFRLNRKLYLVSIQICALYCKYCRKRLFVCTLYVLAPKRLLGGLGILSVKVAKGYWPSVSHAECVLLQMYRTASSRIIKWRIFIVHNLEARKTSTVSTVSQLKVLFYERRQPSISSRWCGSRCLKQSKGI